LNLSSLHLRSVVSRPVDLGISLGAPPLRLRSAGSGTLGPRQVEAPSLDLRSAGSETLACRCCTGGRWIVVKCEFTYLLDGVNVSFGSLSRFWNDSITSDYQAGCHCTLRPDGSPFAYWPLSNSSISLLRAQPTPSTLSIRPCRGP
jgi:hypothetical protein